MKTHPIPTLSLQFYNILLFDSMNKSQNPGNYLTGQELFTPAGGICGEIFFS